MGMYSEVAICMAESDWNAIKKKAVEEWCATSGKDPNLCFDILSTNNKKMVTELWKDKNPKGDIYWFDNEVDSLEGLLIRCAFVDYHSNESISVHWDCVKWYGEPVDWLMNEVKKVPSAFFEICETNEITSQIFNDGYQFMIFSTKIVIGD